MPTKSSNRVKDGHKDTSFKSCIYLLALVSLSFFFIVILILCSLKGFPSTTHKHTTEGPRNNQGNFDSLHGNKNVTTKTPEVIETFYKTHIKSENKDLLKGTGTTTQHYEETIILTTTELKKDKPDHKIDVVDTKVNRSENKTVVRSTSVKPTTIDNDEEELGFALNAFAENATDENEIEFTITADDNDYYDDTPTLISKIEKSVVTKDLEDVRPTTELVTSTKGFKNLTTEKYVKSTTETTDMDLTTLKSILEHSTNAITDWIWGKVTSKSENLLTEINEVEDIQTTESIYSRTENKESITTPADGTSDITNDVEIFEQTTEITEEEDLQSILAITDNQGDVTTATNEMSSNSPAITYTETTPINKILDEISTTEVYSTTIEAPLDDDLLSTSLESTSVNYYYNNSTVTSEISTDLIPNTSIKLPEECIKPLPVCESINCKQSASLLIGLIDHTVDPCDDFYKFSCGGKKINVIGDPSEDDLYKIDLEKLSNNNDYMKNYKIFHKSCMNYDVDLARDTAGYFLKTLTQNISEENKFKDLTDLIGNIILFHPYESSTILKPIFDVIMEVNPDGNLMPVITMPLYTSPLIDADGGDIYRKVCKKDVIQSGNKNESISKINESYLDCLEYSSLYIKNLKRALFDLRLYDHLPEYNKTQLIGKIALFVELDVMFRIGILTHTTHLKTLKYNNDNATYYTIDDLNKKYSQIDWTILFARIFPKHNLQFTKIKIMFPEFIEKIFNFYQSMPYSDIQTSLLAMIAHDIYVDFIRPIKTERELFCTKVSRNLMPDIAAKIYLDKFEQSEIIYKQNIAKSMFKQIKQNMIASFDDVTWLNDNEKNDVTSKLNKIRIVIDRGTIYQNEMLLLSKVDGITFTGCFITNTIALKKKKRTLMYEVYGKSAKDLEYIWTFLKSPLETSALSIKSLNSIILPFRLISRTISDKSRALNKYEYFPKLGYVMASELAHFFDTQNLQKTNLFHNGNFQNFIEIQLSDPQITNFLNPYKIYFTNKDIELTKDTRFADDAGLRIAYETYKNVTEIFQPSGELPFLWFGMDVEQIFYTTFAQQFCTNDDARASLSIELIESEYLPNYFRLNSMIMNDVNFYEIFNCPVGSSMNPPIKMNQFPYIIHTDIDYNTDDELFV